LELRAAGVSVQSVWPAPAAVSPVKLPGNLRCLRDFILTGDCQTVGAFKALAILNSDGRLRVLSPSDRNRSHRYANIKYRKVN
jgi:hypothetical protein